MSIKKKDWDKVKCMKSGIHLPSYPIKIGDNDLPTNAEKAEAFVDMFAKVSKTGYLPPDIKHYREIKERVDNQNKSSFNNSYSLQDINQEITLEEMSKEISLFRNENKAVGLDGISNQMLKHIPTNVLDFIHALFQKCWQSGILPSIWKESIVIPIHKKGKSKHEVNSYRPISLTSHVCKLLERIVLKRLTYFCDKNQLIPTNQAGFRKNRNTTEHLVKLTTHIKQQFSKRKNVLATFFDIHKAYDQVWHYRLLRKLETYNIHGNIFNYIADFLMNRYIQVRINHTYSSRKYLDMGLPQGSILSPLLFNILMSDLPKKLSKNTYLAQFADDICMWQKISIKTNRSKRWLKYIQINYQQELNQIGTFFK